MPSSSSSSPPSEWINLYIAVYPQGAGYKHWALFVDDSPTKLLFHAEGHAGNFRFEEETKDPRQSRRHPELVEVTSMHKGKTSYLQRYARELPLNRGHGWNCQDYVKELIQKAVDEEIIEVTDAKMRQIEGMIEGLA